jgi:thioredoxin-like negative regulator of GroEL
MPLRGRKRRKELEDDTERAHQLFTRGSEAAALDFIADAVARHPEDAELRLLHATLLLEYGPDRAGEEALKALELGPDDDPVFLVRVANPLMHADLIEEARTAIARARELAPPDFLFEPELQNGEGKLAAIDGRFEVAEPLYRSALAAEPDNGPFALDLARFLKNRGRPEEAVAVIDEAIPRVLRGQEGLREMRDEITR